MNFSRTQARVDLAARRKAVARERPSFTHFEPDDLSYLRGLKGALVAAGLMPPGVRDDGLIGEQMYTRARAVRDRLDAVLGLTDPP